MSETALNRPMIYVLSAMLILGVIDNLIVLISDVSSLWTFHAARTAIAVPLIFLMARLSGRTLRAKRPAWVVLRNVFTATALLIYFGCLAFLPIGIVVAGLFTAPIFVLILSVLFCGQRAGIRRWGAVVLGFVGVAFMVQPEEGAFNMVAILPAIAGLFYAIGAIGTRAWCAQEDPLVMSATYFMVLGVAGLAALGVLAVWPVQAVPGPDGWVTRGFVRPDATMLWVLVLQAVGSIFGTVLLTRAYQIGEASFVATFEYSVIVFAAVFALVFWGQTLSPLALLGCGCIILSGVIIAVRSP